MQDIIFAIDCPTRAVLTTLGNKWAVLVMMALRDAPKRFGLLRRQIEGISQKMLTQTLRLLERDGLISRTVYTTRPVAVDYALTDTGKSLSDVMHQLRLWSEAHIDEVLRSREMFATP